MSVDISIDADWCQGNGLCELKAPAIFMLREGKATAPASADEDGRAVAQAAADACPTQAITVT